MFVKRLHVNPSPFPFRDVLAVMDRLDLTNPPGTPDRQALVARVRNVCEAGDLPTDGVEAAVDAHLAATNTPKPAKVSGGTPRMGFGWRRPRQMAEQQRWSTPPFWIRTIANIADEGQARLGGPVCGVALGLGLDLSVTTPTHPWLLLGLSMGASCLAWRLVFLCGRRRRDAQEVFPSLDQLNRWASRPDTRAYIQRCLESTCPILMQGDLDQLKKLDAQHLEAKRQQAEAKRIEQEHKSRAEQRRRVHDQFQHAMTEQDGKRAARQHLPMGT